MQNLEPPVNRHITGKLPSHSSTTKLAENFKNLDRNALKFVLSKEGLMTDEGKPTKMAVEADLIDRCEKSALWNLDEVARKLLELNFPVDRQYVNQELPKIVSFEPIWVNLGTLGTYFNATANLIGKWLDELGMRDEDGMADQVTIEEGLATVMEMSAGGKKTRKINQWNLRPMQERLLEAGHPLDFDYAKNLKGAGKNSDVEVTSLDDRAKEFAKEFLKLFKNPETRNESVFLVRKTPKVIQKKGEELFKKPGFITTDQYLKHLKR